MIQRKNVQTVWLQQEKSSPLLFWVAFLSISFCMIVF